MMVDLRGKTFVIADANSGHGSATARAVACGEPGGYYGPKRLRGDPQRVNLSAKSRDWRMAATSGNFREARRREVSNLMECQT
jgi:hypothetical protein